MHDDTDHIVKFVLGELDEAQAEHIRQRLALDPDAASRAARLQRALQALQRAEELEPTFAIEPERLARLQQAAMLTNPTAPNSLQDQEPAPSAARRLTTLIARLISDSWAAQTAHAIRGADGARSLTFLCQGHTIELRLEPSLERLGMFAVVGRATGPKPASILWRELDADIQHQCPADDLGFFELLINPGRHSLDIATDLHTLCTPTFAHGPDQPGSDDQHHATTP